MSTEQDIEKKGSLTDDSHSVVAESEQGQPGWLRNVSSKLTSFGVETHGYACISKSELYAKR